MQSSKEHLCHTLAFLAVLKISLIVDLCQFYPNFFHMLSYNPSC